MKQKKCSNCKHNKIHIIEEIPFARECKLKGYPHKRNEKGECMEYEGV
jgi:hypothetical protein